MSDFTEMSQAFEQLRIERYRAERIMAEVKETVAIATQALAAANKALLSLTKALKVDQGLRPVPRAEPEMAVWMETKK